MTAIAEDQSLIIGMLKLDSAVAPRIDEATRAGVKIVACENTMKGQKLARGDISTALTT